MLVVDLVQRVREALSSASPSAHDPEILQFLEVMSPYSEISLNTFQELVAKIKKPKIVKPKKTPEELSAEALAKAQAKIEAARLKAEEKAKQKVDAAKAKADAAEAKKAAAAEAKQKAADAKKQAAEAKKQAAEDKKAEDAKAKADAAEAKKQAAEAAKAEKKAKAEADKIAKKEEAERQQLANMNEAAQSAIDGIQALLMRFRNGNVPREAVEAELAKLEPLKAPQLLVVARSLNADATLTDKSPRAKILKQLTEMVMRVWKTSDNVNH
ncbi:MAG: hypothetical protein ACRC8S_12290 [Fimbriiglobus sp.]